MSYQIMRTVITRAEQRANGAPLSEFYGADSVTAEFNRARLRHDLLKLLQVTPARAEELVQEFVR